ncbi:glycosyltransferase [Halieaceae bacterium IMCC14734]|uniref:Glycosyltransferase n=1 Tax=Candidatus Litorirhabdus singularis TaxID=2518993 RepID=A0ABT3TET2_9GAMM|nr:glycosyltransferase [Candidatus Litorirhabdus singularis]MCX2980818.1 glycosyltransferase [Candidatus Litorirhabdus singularis]
MSKVRVLQIIKGLGLGGAERVVCDIVRTLDHSRYELTVAYLLPHKNALVAELEALGVEVVCLSEGDGMGVASSLRLWRLLSSKQFDLVHAHLPSTGIWLRLFRPFFSFRLLYTEHNLWSSYGLLIRWLNRLTYPLNSVSMSCSVQVWRSAGERGIVIRNGIDLDRFQVSPAKDMAGNARICVAICVANLNPKKNHAMLLEAVATMPLREGFRLLLVGQDGHCREALEGQAAALGLSDIVIFHGPSADVVGLIAGADIFVLSSQFEGLPISLLEAMAAGLPAVCTNVGGISEALIDGETGYLVAKSDTERFSLRLSELVDNESKRRDFGAAARKRAELNFGLEKMVASLDAIYCKQLAQ